MKPKRPVSVFRYLNDQPYLGANRVTLYNSAKGSLGFVQRLGLLKELPVHHGCVNCICWSDSGDLLLSGSDDQRLVITNAHTLKEVTDYKTSHRANIFSAKFLPNSGDRNIVSCSGDGIILFTDLTRTSDIHTNQFNCHTGTTYDVTTVPGEPYTFLSCGEDSTVRCFDLRIKESCYRMDCTEDVLISCQRAVTALTVNSTAPHELAIGSSDSTVRIFDRRNLGTKSSGYSKGSCVRPMMSLAAPGLEGRSFRITSLAYSPEGHEILVSYSSEHLYLFSCRDQSCTTLEPSLDEDDEDDDDLEVAERRAVTGQRRPATLVGPARGPGLPPIRRLRLRGDWSDTGPDARPEREPGRSGDVGQARPTLHATLMQRMTDVLSRMLNDPATRAALSHGGEEDNPPTGPSEVDVGAGGEELVLPFVHSGERLEENPLNLLITPDRSPVHATEGATDMMWTDDVNTSQQSAVPSTSSSSSSSSSASTSPPSQKQPPPRKFSLPSFKTIYSVYTNTADPLPPSALDNASGVANASAVATSDGCCSVDASTATSSEVPGINVDEPSTSSASSSSAPPLAPPPSSAPPPPSSSSSASSSAEPMAAGSSDNGSTPTDQENVSNLTDQLFTMRHGFIEKHGTEPMVNLHYSEKGSTTSRITMSVADEVNREVASTSTSTSTSASTSTSTSSSNPPSQGAIAASPSASSSSSSSADVNPPVDPIYTQNNPLRPEAIVAEDTLRGLIRPDERHFENLLETARGKRTDRPINPLCEKTKVPKHTPVKIKFTGHRNARTMIKEATFWGRDHVLSGSDCGHVFVWERTARARLVMLLEADHHVVNCVQPHPHLPLLATSGIDYDVKLWAPVREEAAFNAEMAEELMKRNEVMLEETKDTITVPASFMIRMLACLNQIRRSTRPRPRRFESNSSE